MQGSLKLLYSAAAALSLMAMQGTAMAQPTGSEHGAVCKPYGYSNAAGLYSWVGGATNVGSTSMTVICPVVRPAPVVGSTFDVWVSSSTSSCWLYSYNWTGAALAAVGPSNNLVMNSFYTPPFSYQSVVCVLPPGGRIVGISPTL